MDFTIDVPADLFGPEYTREAFGERLRELAILELVRVKRMHEHEAAAMLGIARWELVERMKAVGIEPTESTFDALKSRLDNAISRRDARIKPVSED